jgi:hypothetical protein
MVTKTKKLDAKLYLKELQKCVSDGKSTVMLPLNLHEIYDSEIWKEWTTPAGRRYKSFLAAITAPQPHGAGIGQHHDWISALQAWHLCTGRKKVREELLKAACKEAKPIAAHGGAREQGSNSTLKDRGAEYLLGRLKRDHPEIVARLASGELTSIRRAAIKAGIIKVPSDRDRCPIQRIKMYWKRANPKQRKEFLAWLKTAESKVNAN